MSFQVGIGPLGGTVFFQVGLCTPLQTMVPHLKMIKRFFSSTFVLDETSPIHYLKENAF